MKKDENKEEIEELKNKYLRSLADYQNLEKQTQAWRDEFVKFSNASLILKFLEVLDDLEKAQEHLKDEGIQIIVDKFKNILKNCGLEEINAQGQEFNPENMEAVQTEPGDENHRIVNVLQKGYILNDRVIRPAKVTVSVTSSEVEGSK